MKWLAVVWIGVPLMLGARWIVKELGWKQTAKTLAQSFAFLAWAAVGMWLLCHK